MTERENRAGPAGAPGHNRRDFLRGSGLAAATAVVAGAATQALDEARGATNPQDAGSKVLSGTIDIELKVNGEVKSVQVEPRCTLLDTLRNRLDVTGPKRVCDRAACGACTVILDGEPVYSCTTLAVSCRGHEIETLESFETGEGSVPECFHRHDALMCGYCTPGFVTACKAALDKNPGASLEEIRRGLDGNICRCGTYVGVLQAALDAAKAMKGA